MISIVLFLLVIIIGFLTLRGPGVTYTRDVLRSSQDISNPEAFISPGEVRSLAGEGRILLFIDIRMIYDYNVGHLPEAVHIPETDLLEESRLDLFKQAFDNEALVVVYGNDGLDATGPGQLLRDLGYTNVRVLLGGYQYFNDTPNETDTLLPAYKTEAPRYDYAEMTSSPMESQNMRPDAEAPEIIMPVRKEKGRAEGGC